MFLAESSLWSAPLFLSGITFDNIPLSRYNSAILQLEGKMNEQAIVDLYTVNRWTLRRIADCFDTDHHRIKRILTKHSVPIQTQGQIPKPYTDEHRRKVGLASRGRPAWNKHKKMTETACRRNMAAKLKTSIDLNKYPDFERLKFLTRFLSKHKQHIGYSDDVRQAFLDRFYFDLAFNTLYDQWIAHEQDKWYRPTLDHIEPLSNGGAWALSNLQFLTWFENRAKADMSIAEWQRFRQETNTCSDLFW